MQPKEELKLYKGLLTDTIETSDRWALDIAYANAAIKLLVHHNSSDERRAKTLQKDLDRATRKHGYCASSIERLTADVERLESIVKAGGRANA